MLSFLYVAQNKIKSFADVVRERITELNTSQSDVSRRSKRGGAEGIHPSTISQIVSEKILAENMTIANFNSLARGLQMKPHRLLEIITEGEDVSKSEYIRRIEIFLETLSDDDLELIMLFTRAAADRRGSAADIRDNFKASDGVPLLIEKPSKSLPPVVTQIEPESAEIPMVEETTPEELERLRARNRERFDEDE